MTTNLPAHLQGYQPRALTSTARAALGTGQPPAVSIEGQRFTLVDDGGEEVLTTVDAKVGLYMDCIIIDVNERKSKTFYGLNKKYDPSNPSPPLCFSDNGLAPSQAAGQPQSATCASCPHAVIGSAIGFSGGKTTACRDALKTAVVLPQYPDEVRMLRIPPNSFKNFRACIDWFEKHGAAMEIIVTRVYFQTGVQGTLMFQPIAYNQDAGVHAAIVDALNKKVTDVLVGRTDKPLDPSRQIAAPSAQQPAPVEQSVQQQPAQVQQTVQQTAPQAGQGAPATQQAEPARRRRRNTGAATEPQAAPQQAATAPFRPQQQEMPLTTTAPAQNNFGIAAGAAPNPELQQTLDSIFPATAPQG